MSAIMLPYEPCHTQSFKISSQRFFFVTLNRLSLSVPTALKQLLFVSRKKRRGKKKQKKDIITFIFL